MVENLNLADNVGGDGLREFVLTFSNCTGKHGSTVKYFECDGQAEEYAENALQSYEDKYGMLNWECVVREIYVQLVY